MRGISFFAIIFIFLSIPVHNRIEAEEFLTWQDCITEAAKNHPDLISAQEAVKESAATKKITASTLFPQIDSNLDASRKMTSTTSSGITTKKTSNTFTYGATGTQLLFDGLKTANDVKAASQNLKAAEYNYKFTSSEVRLSLRTAFIKVLKAQELLKISEEIYNIRRGNFELITLRYQSGIEHKGALLTAEANLAEAKYEIAQAKRALEVAQRQLIKEMGRKEFSALRVEGIFKVIDAVLEKPDFTALANNHPSLGKLIAQKNAASFTLRAAKANFFPELSASAGANRTSASWPADNDQWNAGLSLTFPIFEGGLRLAQVSQARALFNQAQENERSSKDGLIVALEQTWAALQDATETVEVQKKFLDAAQERAKISEAQYSVGFISYDNWTIIEDNLVSAKKNFLNAEANALLAEANWIQAKGETLEYAKK